VHYKQGVDAIEGQWIVVYKSGVSAQQISKHKTVLSSVDPNAELLFDYSTVYTGFSGRFNADAVKYLAAQPEVKYIEQDQVVRINQECNSQRNCPWGLARSSVRVPVLAENIYQYGYDGRDVTVYIVDTGIYLAHNDFGGRARFGANYINGEQPTDLNGHGTHVAGTVGGKTYGIAKEVELVAVKVLGANGSGTWAGVIAGIDWSAADSKTGKTKRTIINMSLGGGLSQAVDDACIAAGEQVLVVVASGNNARDARDYSPGNLGNETTDILSVGALTETPFGQKDQPAYFTNFGSSVSVFSPGVAVLSCWWTGPDSTNTISGTSMASPHVAGIAALFAGHSTGDITTGDLKKQLLSWATPGEIVNLPGVGTPNLIAHSPCEGPSRK